MIDGGVIPNREISLNTRLLRDNQMINRPTSQITTTLAADVVANDAAACCLS